MQYSNYLPDWSNLWSTIPKNGSLIKDIGNYTPTIQQTAAFIVMAPITLSVFGLPTAVLCATETLSVLPILRAEVELIAISITLSYSFMSAGNYVQNFSKCEASKEQDTPSYSIYEYLPSMQDAFVYLPLLYLTAYACGSPFLAASYFLEVDILAHTAGIVAVSAISAYAAITQSNYVQGFDTSTTVDERKTIECIGQDSVEESIVN
ncbi:MAG: hypothetical protein DGJ47_000962 [Rickettsiaceae bacterium]